MKQTSILLLLLPIYGITIMAALLDLRRSNLTKQRFLRFAAFAAVSILVNVFVYKVFGRKVYVRFYVLLVQAPLYFGFQILSEYRGIKLLFTLLTTITLASLPVQFVILLRILTGGNGGFMLAGFAAAYLIMLFLVFWLLRPSYIYMLKHGEPKAFWKFCIIPTLYYLYGYLGSGYDFMQYSNLDKIFIRRISDLIVFVSYVMLVDIFKSTNEKQILKNEQDLMLMQLDAATAQIKQLRAAEEQSAIYRHDLRHHMNYLSTCISEDKLQEAAIYIKQTCEGIESTKVIQYSTNESINLILSSYTSKAKEIGIRTDIIVSASDFSRFLILDLCSLLSNALENAMEACKQMKAGQNPYIKLRMYEKSNKLCLDIRNSYDVEPIFEQGIPISHHNGHGIGVKSIIHVVEKHQGVYRFSVKEGIFTFQMSI